MTLQLIKTICSTDWKGRPDHTIKFMGIGSRDELQTLADDDIAKWQAIDLASDEQIAEEDEEEPPTEWETNHRWEMKLEEPASERKEYRQFAERDDNGNTSSTTYHLLPLFTTS